MPLSSPPSTRSGISTNTYRRANDLGESLEILTCGATHGYLPLLNGHRPALRAQLRVAAEQYRQALGRSPKGIWLPECAYQPGLDELLKGEGIEYFFTETHGVLNASPRPLYGVYAPLLTPAGPAVFGRDPHAVEIDLVRVDGLSAHLVDFPNARRVAVDAQLHRRRPPI